MDALSQIEQTYGFTLPSAYRSFVDRGYVTYPGNDYLWVNEAEWLPTTDMLNDGGFWGNQKPGLVAFAFSGRRDLWAWQTERLSELGEPTIAFCPVDCVEGEWYAPSFLGWLYRISLEYASSMWDEEEETKQNLLRWAAVLQEFNQLEWAASLQSVASRSVIIRPDSRLQNAARSLMNHGEVAAIGKISFLSTSFNHTCGRRRTIASKQQLTSTLILHSASSRLRILRAKGSFISLCLGTASVIPFFGFIHIE